MTLRAGERFLYDTHLPHGDWTHGVIMTAALESHSIGVFSVFHCTQGVRAIFCLHLGLLGRGKAASTSGLHLCLISIPDVAVQVARTCFTTSREGLLDTHLLSASVVAAEDRCLASFLFLCHSSQPGSFYDPGELKQCSHMFPGQSKNHHATTYHRPTCLDTPSTIPQPSLPQNARPYSVHILLRTD